MLSGKLLTKFSYFTALIVLAVACAQPPTRTNELKIELLANVNIKLPRDDLFGGLSGIDYDPVSNFFYAISDDRSEKSAARFYRFKLNERYEIVDYQIHPLIDENGRLFSKNEVDAESIRYHPGGWIVWSSELPEDRPSIYITNVSSMETSVFKLPQHIYPNEKNNSGSRKNKFIEGITFTPNHKYIIFSLEAPLVQDGDIPDLESGANTRILVFEVDSQQLVSEYYYGMDPIPYPSEVAPLMQDNGVSEILALDDKSLLVLERSGRHIGDYDFSYDNRIYRVNLMRYIEGSVEKLVKEPFISVGKLVKGQQENIEGMALGPVIDNKQTLYLISDNNFHADHENQLLVFSLEDKY